MSPNQQPSAFRGLSSSSSSDNESSSDESREKGVARRRKKARTSGNASREEEKIAVSLLDAPAASESSEEEEEAVFEPSDVEAALRTLRPRGPPFVVLQHLVYSIVKNRTLADRQVAALARAGKVRVLLLPSGSDDIGIIVADDWRREIDARCGGALAVRFAEFSLRTVDLYVNRAQLEDGVGSLCAAGLLRPRRDAPDCFWFACPDYGSFAKRLQRGRGLLLKALRGAKHREINVDKLNHDHKSTAALLALDDPGRADYCHGGLTMFVNDCLGLQKATLQVKPAGRFLRLVAAPAEA